jgi:O-antigen ligase
MIKGLLTVILIALLALPFVPDEYFGEMQTMSNQDDGTRRQRLFFWGVAWQEFLSSPIIGVGSGNFSFRIADFQESTPKLAAYVAEYQRSYAGRSVHSSYFQIISELGLIGASAFFTMIFSTLLVCRKICKAKVELTPDAKVYAQAVAGALLSTCAGGAFLSAAMFPNFWMLFAMGSAAAAYCLPPKALPGPRIRRKQPAATAEVTQPVPNAAAEPAATRRPGRQRAASRRT